MRNIYLDNAATTPVDPRVFDAMLPWLREEYGNPSSVHMHGRTARNAVEKARGEVADLIGAHPSEIMFTSGGTESNNAALFMMQAMNPAAVQMHVVSSRVEHHAVLEPLQQLAEKGSRVEFLQVTDFAVPELEQLTSQFSSSQDQGRCVSLMHVNNETGGILDLREAAKLSSEVDCIFHTDLVQSAGKIPISIRDHTIHFASFSAHKIHGPKGIGALFIRSGSDVPAWIAGGPQERGRRGGTENLAGIVGFGEAARLARIEMDERSERHRQLFGACTQRLHDAFPHIIVNGDMKCTLPGICSVSFPEEHYQLDGEMLTVRCDLSGLSIASGSACTAGSVLPSHVMQEIGHSKSTSVATVRLSFGAQTTEDDVMRGTEILISVVQEMLERSSPRSHSRTAIP